MNCLSNLNLLCMHLLRFIIFPTVAIGLSPFEGERKDGSQWAGSFLALWPVLIALCLVYYMIKILLALRIIKVPVTFSIVFTFIVSDCLTSTR